MSYPNSIHVQLLNDTYNVNPKPVHTTFNARQLYNIYFQHTAITMGSYSQETNNKRYWPSPDNGMSLVMGLNNSVYPHPDLLYR